MTRRDLPKTVLPKISLVKRWSTNVTDVTPVILPTMLYPYVAIRLPIRGRCSLVPMITSHSIVTTSPNTTGWVMV